MNLLSIVQRPCRQRAAIAALAPHIEQRGTPCVRLACSRSRDRRGAAKTEGKIKGPARAGPPSQSARGVGAAQRLAACVPSQNANPTGIEVDRVPSSIRFAALRWSLCHGLA